MLQGLICTMNHLGQQIDSLEMLSKVVGKTKGPRDLKVIDHLDSYAQKWVAASTCLIATHDNGQQISVQIGGGMAGFVTTSHSELNIAVEYLDKPAAISEGDGWGSLFLISGFKETLRVNGMVRAIEGNHITVTVNECYLHCAKAFIRSNFWQAEPVETAYDSAASFCADSNFMLVGTSDKQKNADLSPKGDPAGKLLFLDQDDVWFADRPGNRRVDGFRNILMRPKTEIVAMVPGSTQVLRLKGDLRLYTKSSLAQHFAVKSKEPSIVAQIENAQTCIEQSPALQRAKLWPAVKPDLGFKATEIWQAHMAASKLGGIEATLAKAAVALPGALQVMLDQDYKHNMY